MREGVGGTEVTEGVLFAGRLVDPEGALILAGVVSLRLPNEDAVLGSDVSREDGRFAIELDGPINGRLELDASAEGFAASTRRVDPGDDLEMELQFATTLYGVVRDASSGLPLAGARLRHGRVEFESGPQGAYRIPGVTIGGTVRLVARLEGYAPHPLTLLVPDRGPFELDIELERGHPFDVQVVDRDSRSPLAGAQIELRDDKGTAAQADASGRFRLWVVDGTEVSMEVRHEGYVPLTWRWDVPDAGALPAPRLPLIKGAWIEGRVLDLDGVPVAWVYVASDNAEESVLRERIEEPEARSFDLPGYADWNLNYAHARPNEAGHFELLVRPSASPWTVTAMHQEFVDAESEPLLLNASGQRAFVELTLVHGATIRGRVLYNGEPWTGGEVACVRASGERVGRSWTGGEGNYEFKGVLAGPVKVESYGESSQVVRDRATLTVENGQVYEQDLGWEEELGVISGWVAEPQGEPLVDVLVRARSGHERDFMTRTGADGTYRLEVALGLSYRVSAFRPPEWDFRPDVLPGASGVDFTFAPVRMLTVQLIDAIHRKPIAGMHVGSKVVEWRISDSDERYRRVQKPGRARSVYAADNEGRVEFAVPEGYVDLRIDLGDLGFMRREILNVFAGTETEEIVVALEQGAVVSARLANDQTLDRDVRRAHLFLLLGESELDPVRLSQEGEPYDHRINGIEMMNGGVDLERRLVHLGDDGQEARTRVLPPGRYTLRAFPGDLAFDPPWFDLMPGKNEIEFELR